MLPFWIASRFIQSESLQKKKKKMFNLIQYTINIYIDSILEMIVYYFEIFVINPTKRKLFYYILERRVSFNIVITSLTRCKILLKISAHLINNKIQTTYFF